MEYSTDQRMRAHIIITLIVLAVVFQKLGAGFFITTLALGVVRVQAVVPSWAVFVALGVSIVLLRRYRAAVLGPIAEWMRWVLVGERDETSLN